MTPLQGLALFILIAGCAGVGYLISTSPVVVATALIPLLTLLAGITAIWAAAVLEVGGISVELLKQWFGVDQQTAAIVGTQSWAERH